MQELFVCVASGELQILKPLVHRDILYATTVHKVIRIQTWKRNETCGNGLFHAPVLANFVYEVQWSFQPLQKTWLAFT